MTKLNQNPNGFSIVGVLVIVLTLAVIGVVGYVVTKQADKKTAPPVTTSTTTKAPAATATTSVVTIAPLGIELTVPNSLNDLTYAVTPPELGGGQTTTVGISTASLLAADSSPSSLCSASQGPLGWLSKTAGTYPSNVALDDTAAISDAGGGLVKQYPSYYISYIHAQDACSPKSSAVAMQNTDEILFSGAIGNSLTSNIAIQPIN